MVASSQSCDSGKSNELPVSQKIKCLCASSHFRFVCSICFLFSKSVLDIRTRLVITVEPETKWMPNSDSASKRMPKCQIFGSIRPAKLFLQLFENCRFLRFLYSFYIKLNLGEKSFPQICFHMESPYNS